MACAITDGYKQNNCPLPTQGAYQTFYLMNLADIVGWTGSGTANEYEAITFAAGKGAYKFQVQRDSVDVRSEKQEEEGGSVNYTQEGIAKILDMSVEARNRVDEMNGVDLVGIFRTKADTFEIVGFDNGARLATHVRGTTVEELGNAFTIRAINQPGPTKHFFDTSVNTTLALLETYVVGS